MIHLDFSIIKNCELMQTTNDKWKYKLQQLFKMLSLSLDTGLESFSLLVNGPINNDGQFAVSWDLNQSLLQFSQVACCALAWCGCCHRNRTVGTQAISRFSNAINPQLNADAFCEFLWKISIFHSGCILTKLCQSVLGVRFFKTQCITRFDHSC